MEANEQTAPECKGNAPECTGIAQTAINDRGAAIASAVANQRTALPPDPLAVLAAVYKPAAPTRLARGDAAFSFRVGRLLCGSVRDFLVRQNLLGRTLRWHEGTGWISRHFTIAGPEDDVVATREALTRWFASLE